MFGNTIGIVSSYACEAENKMGTHSSSLVHVSRYVQIYMYKCLPPVTLFHRCCAKRRQGNKVILLVDFFFAHRLFNSHISGLNAALERKDSFKQPILLLLLILNMSLDKPYAQWFLYTFINSPAKVFYIFDKK